MFIINDFLLAILKKIKFSTNDKTLDCSSFPFTVNMVIIWSKSNGVMVSSDGFFRIYIQILFFIWRRWSSTYMELFNKLIQLDLVGRILSFMNIYLNPRRLMFIVIFMITLLCVLYQNFYAALYRLNCIIFQIICYLMDMGLFIMYM